MGRNSGGVRGRPRGARQSQPSRRADWGGLYAENGKRVEYKDLSEEKKQEVLKKADDIAKQLRTRLKGNTVQLQTDNATIEVGFTRKGINHSVRDSMLTHSGKHLDETDLLNIDKILSKAKYVPTTHELTKQRHDGKTMFFKFADSQGRTVFFKVAYEPNQGGGLKYYLHSITDK